MGECQHPDLHFRWIPSSQNPLVQVFWNQKHVCTEAVLQRSVVAKQLFVCEETSVVVDLIITVIRVWSKYLCE